MAVAKSTRRRLLVRAHSSRPGSAAHLRERLPARLAPVCFHRRIELGRDGVTLHAPRPAIDRLQPTRIRQQTRRHTNASKAAHGQHRIAYAISFDLIASWSESMWSESRTADVGSGRATVRRCHAVASSADVSNRGPVLAKASRSSWSTRTQTSARPTACCRLGESIIRMLQASSAAARRGRLRPASPWLR